MLDLRSVDLNLLVSLDALLDERNVTRAARRLHLSQPALSAQLSRLRLVFRDPLLMPAETGRGMSPTARALELVEPLHAALKGLEAVVTQRPSFDPRTDARDFQIVASDNATVLLVLPMMEGLEKVASPRVRLAFRVPDWAQSAAQMERGDIDLVIGSDRMVPNTMKVHKLMAEHFVVAQRKGHPRGRKPMTIEAYCKLKHVLVSISGGAFDGVMDEHLVKLKRRRDVVLSVQQFNVVPEVLRGTDYVSTIPSRLARRFADVLDSFELPFRSEGFSLYAGWHPRNHHDPANTWLRDYVAQCAQSRQ